MSSISAVEQLGPPTAASERRSEFKSLVNKTLLINAGTFAVSLANDAFIAHAPVSFSQTVMEGTDSALPFTLKRADTAERRGKSERALKWRSVTNVAHIAAASAGIIEAARFIDNPADMSWRNIAISGLIAAGNLGIFRHIRKHRQHMAHLQEATPDGAFSDPIEVTEDALAETPLQRRHASRNLENLQVCAATNIIEAGPAFAGPLMQMGWENGSAASVIAANGVILCMMGRQFVKDMRLMHQTREQERLDAPDWTPEPAYGSAA